MRCTYCGAAIPDDILYCPKCKQEVQIVPDYNPLEDVLAQEVKGSVRDATRQLKTDDIRRHRFGEAGEYSNATRILNQGELDQIRAHRNIASGRDEKRRNTGDMRSRPRPLPKSAGSERQSVVSQRQNTGGMSQLEGEERRRRKAQKKKLAKKRRSRVLILLLISIALLGGLAFFLYQNSYEGQIKKGNQALNSGQYSLAEACFKKAIYKNQSRGEAYTGLSNVYIKQDDMDGAEAVFLTALSSQPSNAEIYKVAIQFYIDTKQLIKISQLLDGDQDDAVLQAVRPYVSQPPQFSLKEGSYSEVQQITLKSGEGTVYYTTDGSEPDTSSTKYTEPILLKEGQTTIKAFSVNKKKIPSLTVTKVYTVDIPVVDAPAVTPSTGQYDSPTQITINVPEGYTAYYTTDGTNPTADSNVYTAPIDMPGGQTMFSAVLVNKSGKSTQITKRNYVLELTE